MLLGFLAGCSGPDIDPGGPVIDLHTHCSPENTACDVSALEAAEDGLVIAVVAGLSHYNIAETLGDPIPEGLDGMLNNNEQAAEAAAASESVLLMPSLECLRDTPGSSADFTAACLEDADAWIAAGAVGFKDHAGKTFDGSGYDVALWVGAFNRLAGFCTPADSSQTPNRDCLADPGLTFPLALEAYRAVVAGVVEDREKVWLTHATPWHGSEEQCGGEQTCHAAAKAVLLDFAAWAEDSLTVEARRRIVLAHMAFLQDDGESLQAVLDAGLTVDLAQTDFVTAGCRLRDLVSLYPEQVVLGTDVMHGLSCVAEHYAPWIYALTGPAGASARYRNTCRGTLEPVGAELNTPVVSGCSAEVPEGAGRAVLYDNAAALLGL